MARIELETNVGRSLEALVDANGLQAIIEALAEIAYGKADHVAETWQDKALAKRWKAAGRQLAATADTKTLEQLALLEGR